MKLPMADRTGIFIVRLWLEGNAQQGFRARMTQTLDSTGDQKMSMAANADDVYSAVRTWVEAFVNGK